MIYDNFHVLWGPQFAEKDYGIIVQIKLHVMNMYTNQYGGAGILVYMAADEMAYVKTFWGYVWQFLNLWLVK